MVILSLLHATHIETNRPRTRRPSTPVTLIAAAVGTAVRLWSTEDAGGCSPVVTVLGSGTSVGTLRVLESGISSVGTMTTVVDSGSDVGVVSGGGLVSDTVVGEPPGGGGVVGVSGDTVSTDVTVVIVGSTRSPLMVGMAYGGSKRPNRPQALHGDAHDLTVAGAARIGSHRPLGIIVAISVGSTLCGQLVPRSFSVSCRVTEPPGTTVDISFRSAANTGLEAAGPARPAELVPYIVLITMYTDGEVLVFMLTDTSRERGWVFLQGIVEPCMHVCRWIRVVVTGGPVEQVHRSDVPYRYQ